MAQGGYVGGYVEWDSDQEMIAARRAEADLNGLTPKAIRQMTIDFVQDGGHIDQRVETRENHLDFAFYYRVILLAEGFPRGIFVELRLVDDDPEDPVVHLGSGTPTRGLNMKPFPWKCGKCRQRAVRPDASDLRGRTGA